MADTAEITLEGTVERIAYQDGDSAFTVAKDREITRIGDYACHEAGHSRKCDVSHHEASNEVVALLQEKGVVARQNTRYLQSRYIPDGA